MSKRKLDAGITQVIDRAEEENGDVLGYFVFWDIATSSELNLQALMDLVKQYPRLSTTLGPQQPEAIMQRTLTHYKNQILHSTYGKVCRVPTDPDMECTIYSLKGSRASEDKGRERDIDFVTEVKMLYDKALVKLNKKNNTNDDPWEFTPRSREDDLRPIMQHYIDYAVAWDVTSRVIQTTIDDCYGVIMRPNGGLYFVPARFREEIHQLRDFVTAYSAACEQPCQLRAISVYNDASNREDIWHFAFEAMMSQIADINRECAQAIKSAAKVRPATNIRRMEAANRIGSQASIYRDLLHIQADKIDAAINQLRQTLTEMRDAAFVKVPDVLGEQPDVVAAPVAINPMTIGQDEDEDVEQFLASIGTAS